MNFKNLMFNPAFMRMQNQSSLISRMMGSSSKMGVMGSPQYMSKASMKAYSKIMAKQIQSYDSFSRTESASKTEDKAEYSRVAGQVNRAGGTNNYTPTPKATLADVTAAFDDARAANHAKLDNAGNEIIAVNDRAGRDLMYASTRINGARYDYQSTQYISGGAYLDKIDQNAFNRQMVNRQIGNILSEKGISVGEGEEYTFTVDAYSNRITVSGADADKARAIEDALNSGENGKNLYEHIKLCSQWEKDLSGEHEKNEQLSNGGLALRYASELMREKLGVNLSQVTRQGDDYVTEDGQSVKELFAKYAQEHPTSGFTVQAETDLYHSYIDRALAQEGAPKMDLSIRYDVNGLHDIGQKHSYGTGDTAWIDEYVQELAKETGKTVLTTFINSAEGENAKIVAAQPDEGTKASEEAEGESTKSGGCVGINAAKLARMLAAAKTRAQVQAVLAKIQADLKECDAGKEQGMDVDEASYSAAEQLLQQAQQQLGQAENREATPEEEMASALASLM